MLIEIGLISAVESIIESCRVSLFERDLRQICIYSQFGSSDQFITLVTQLFE